MGERGQNRSCPPHPPPLLDTPPEGGKHRGGATRSGQRDPPVLHPTPRGRGAPGGRLRSPPPPHPIPALGGRWGAASRLRSPCGSHGGPPWGGGGCTPNLRAGCWAAAGGVAGAQDLLCKHLVRGPDPGTHVLRPPRGGQDTLSPVTPRLSWPLSCSVGGGGGGGPILPGPTPLNAGSCPACGTAASWDLCLVWLPVL